jgi:hypothetical protein
MGPMYGSSEIRWFNNQAFQIPEGSSVAAEIFTQMGAKGIRELNWAVKRRDAKKIQDLIDGRFGTD